MILYSLRLRRTFASLLSSNTNKTHNKMGRKRNARLSTNLLLFGPAGTEREEGEGRGGNPPTGEPPEKKGRGWGVRVRKKKRGGRASNLIISNGLTVIAQSVSLHSL